MIRPSSQIRDFTICMKKVQVISYLLNAEQKQVRFGVCPGIRVFAGHTAQVDGKTQPTREEEKQFTIVPSEVLDEPQVLIRVLARAGHRDVVGGEKH